MRPRTLVRVLTLIGGTPPAPMHSTGVVGGSVQVGVTPPLVPGLRFAGASTRLLRSSGLAASATFWPFLEVFVKGRQLLSKLVNLVERWGIG